jgi:tetratricopeptide (TPR) repeat protein
MRRKKAILAVLFILAAGLYLAAEVALDEVVQAGRFVLYRDHADAHKYYYVPDAPRLATKRDGTPEFAFIKYAKTDGETKGGIVHFLVTWGMSEGELSSAESALRLKDSEAKIAGPVPFKEGTFKVVSATAGEGGIFSRRIVGEGKAPIMPGQKAAVSIALTEEGASLLWESFKNPTSDISVMFDLRFTGVTPAFQAKLKVNWDKVYTQHDIKLHAEGQIKVVKLQADVRAILEELRQKGAIQLEVVGENENMQKMLDVVYAHLLSLMCEKVPMGPGEAASTPAIKRPVPVVVADWPAGHPSWSLGVLAEVVHSADERLRGGPFWDQDQVQAQRAAGATCDEQSRQKADSFEQRAVALLREKKYTESNGIYQQAYEACPDPKYLYEMGMTEAFSLFEYDAAVPHFRDFLQRSADLSGYADQRATAQAYMNDYQQAHQRMERGKASYDQGKYYEALDDFRWLYDHIPLPTWIFNMAVCYKAIGDQTGNKQEYENALRCLEAAINLGSANPDRFQGEIDDAGQCIEILRPLLEPAAAARPPAEQTQRSAEDERRARREQAQQQAQTGQTQTAAAGAQQATTTAGAQTGGTKPPGAAEGGTKPPAGQAQAADVTGGQSQQQIMSLHGTKPPDTGGGAKPPAGQTPPAKTTPPAPGAKPAAQAPEIKPIVSVQVGYSFKRVKMSGNYEVDMRKRLREDRDIVMSGNIGGIYQKYGEDKRFFSIVSLDDPTFQERSVEVILDGQDASDFKNYINSVSVLFRKQRFSGAPMTGEVKFIDQQFAQSGNCLSFKYGRLNEASTEWLDYEYKPKWSFYGGVEWEGDWTKTSDSVLTLSPPVLRRTLEISVDEDNILKNGVKALALQIKHRIYGKDVLKEVIINYDKGDPLQADYTYLHEDGNLGYSYKVVWLFLDGREIHTDWMTKESPFIYAVYTKK